MCKQSETPSKQPTTYFAPAERATSQEVQQSVRMLSEHPMLAAALESLEGWLAVLNEHRQVLAVNDAFLSELGVKVPGGVLGLRPGEVLSCAHAHDHPGGCGTSKFCSTCGAAISILAAQHSGSPQQAECIITQEQGGQRLDRAFFVRCSSFSLGGEPLLLLSMRDISDEKDRAALERIFLHDVSNTVTALAIATAAMPVPEDADGKEIRSLICQAAGVLAEEVRVQRILTEDEHAGTRVHWLTVTVREVLKQVEALFSTRAPFGEATLRVEYPEEDCSFETDVGLLTRVLGNMVVNALEMNLEGGEARLGTTLEPQHINFHVWNRQQIPDKVALRVFQRYFSTKPGRGRGLGTFSMKMLGERFLRGQVSFETSEAEGTTFNIRLPLKPE